MLQGQVVDGHECSASRTEKNLYSTLPSPSLQNTPPQIYVYARNARFFESDDESATKILEGHGQTTTNSKSAGPSTGKAAPGAAAEEGEGGRKVQAPSAAGVPGLVTVTGPPLAAPGEGSLAVVFFFATWCASCEKVLPAILSVAARYSEDGKAGGAAGKGA